MLVSPTLTDCPRQSAKMGFDTMGSYQRIMLATYMHEQDDHDSDNDRWEAKPNDLHLERTDSAHYTTSALQQNNLELKECRTPREGPHPGASTPRAIHVSAPSFRETTSGWSPPLSPRSKSPGSSPTATSSNSATSFTESVPSTPASAKEKNALANKLYTAACAGDLDTVTLLLSVGVPVESSTLVPGLFDSFKPPKPGHLSTLAGAASCGQFEAVKLLIAHGAQLNPNSNQSASSPLHQAIRNNDMRIVRYLLEQGADVNILNSYNTTPIMYAVKYSAPELIACVLQYKPDLNKLSFIGAAALHWSIWPSNPESTELLLRAGSDPNMAMLDGNSALHCAALSGSIQKVQCLLKYGANPHYRNAENKTPADTAAEAGSDDIAQLLKSAMSRI